jgi:hypothetical protein
MSRVATEVQALGLKVTRLSNDWNHLLSRQHGSLTRDQLDLIDAAKAAPATVDVHVMRAPDSALSAFAMTNESARTAGLPGRGKKDKPPNRIVLPINPTTSVTLERVRYTTDELGCAWVGVVAETGESAVLIRWNDGNITGIVGYKGHIYRVSGLGG